MRDLIGTKQADLWVLPELFNSGYLFTHVDEVKALAEPIPDGETAQFLIDFARTHHTSVIAGMAERYEDRLYNSSIMVDTSGLVSVYRKIHLFDREKLWFSPGDQSFHVSSLGAASVGMMICFDWFFPESARSLALQGADIIAHPANLVLPFCQNAMVTRCLENRVFAVTTNRIGTEHRDGMTLTFTGKSQITSPNGTILFQADDNNEIAYSCKIDLTYARNKNVTGSNHLFDDRRPEMYRLS